ncbi:MAG: GNAT family N-acetyltransferase [Anaerolineae bacterium]|nr:GNAT family N-acetyltransferase [Anaerolineae bacterium]
MQNYTSRPYSADEDLQAILEFLLAVRPADRVASYPSPVDLHEMFALQQVQDNTRLWFDAEGHMVGYALVDHYNNLLFEFKPQAFTSEIEAEIIALGIACIQRATQEEGETLTLDASCRANDTEKIAFLTRHGFEQQEGYSIYMVRPLDQPISTPQLPEGFTIRHVLGEEEVEALVALHRAAVGTEHMTVEERLAMMRVPEYKPELDLLAATPDGQLVAYCMCGISEEENAATGRNEGYTDPVGTHPDFQRRGLARALMLTGLQALKQRGMDFAVLGTSGENIAMRRTAEAVGFHVESTTLWFARPVTPA